MPGYQGPYLTNRVPAKQGELPRTPLLKLSEKPRRRLQRSLASHRNGIFRLILTSVYWPNPRSERRLHPFLDSFSSATLSIWEGKKG